MNTPHPTDQFQPDIPTQTSTTLVPNPPTTKGKDKKNKKDKSGNQQQQPSPTDPQHPYTSYQNETMPLLAASNTANNEGNGQKKPKSKYDMKNHMANERTYFKYLFTGLHIGSIGTLVLTFFPTMDINKLYLVLFIWIIAFGFMFWGLYGYYRRKSLMESGVFKEANEISPHTPLLITGIFVFVIICVVCYGMYVHMEQDGEVNVAKLLLMTSDTPEPSLQAQDPTQLRQQHPSIHALAPKQKEVISPSPSSMPTIADYLEKQS